MFLYPGRARIVGLLIALTLIVCQGLAQIPNSNESSLRVSVVDPTGAAITRAHVQLSAAENNGKKQGVSGQALETNERGESLFTRIAPGRYRIHVEAVGFEPRDMNDINLKAGSNRVEARLNIEGIKEEVAVRQDEREKMTDPRGSAFSTVLTPDQIAQLPDDPD